MTEMNPPSKTAPNLLLRAWSWLICLSAGSALVSVALAQGAQRQVAGVVVVLLALTKARIILARYLGLAQAPGWLRGFTWVIGLFCLLILLLYLIPAFTG